MLSDLTNINTNVTGGGNIFIMFRGSNDQQLTGNSTAGTGKFCNLYVWKSGGSLTLNDVITMGGSSSLSLSSGSINPGHSTVIFSYNNPIRGNWNFHHVEFMGHAGSFIITNGITVEGNVLISGDGPAVIDSAAMEVLGDIDNENADAGTELICPLLLSGGNDQLLSGMDLQVNDFTIDKTAGAFSLGTGLLIGGVLDMESGNIVSSGSRMIILKNGATVTSASSSSFVNGPLTKIGNSSFVFPVGKNGVYNPIGISAPSTSTDEFVAEYFNEASAVTDLVSPITYAGKCEYWNLTETGSSSINITLGWDNPCFHIASLSYLNVARDSSSMWVTAGGSTSGTTTTGSIVSTIARNDWGNVTLGKTNPLVVADAGVDTAICYGQAVTLGGAPTGSGGTSSLSYSWSPSTGLSSSTVANPVATPTETTEYILTVTDAITEYKNDTVVVTINPLPVAEANVDQHLCKGQHALLGGLSTGGTKPFTYIWKDELNNPLDTISFMEIYPDTSHTYFLTVLDAQGCIDKDTLNIVVSPHLSLGIDSAEISFSLGDSVILGLDTLIKGGTAPYHIYWTDGADWSSDTAYPKVSPLTSVLYSVYVTDTNGCQGTTEQLVSLRFPSSATLGGYSILSGDSIIISADTVHANGKVGYKNFIGSVMDTRDSVIHNTGSYAKAMVDLDSMIAKYFRLPIDNEISSIDDETLTSGVYHFEDDLTVSSTVVFEGDSSSYFIMLADSTITFDYGTRMMMHGISEKQILWVTKRNVHCTDTVQLVGSFIGEKKFTADEMVVGRFGLGFRGNVKLRGPVLSWPLEHQTWPFPKGYLTAVINYSVTHRIDYDGDGRQDWLGANMMAADKEIVNDGSAPLVINGGYNDATIYKNLPKFNLGRLISNNPGNCLDLDWNSGTALNEKQLVYPNDLFDFPTVPAYNFIRYVAPNPNDVFLPGLKLMQQRSAFHGAGLKSVWTVNGISSNLDYTKLMTKQVSQLGLEFTQLLLTDEPYSAGTDGHNGRLFLNADSYSEYINYTMNYFTTEASLGHLPDGRPAIGISAAENSVDQLNKLTDTGGGDLNCRATTWNSVLNNSLFGGGANDIASIAGDADAFCFHLFPNSGVAPIIGQKILYYTDLDEFYVKAFKTIDHFIDNEVQSLCAANDMKAWVNSYYLNANDGFITNGSWAEGLFEGCMTLKMLESETITQADFFNLISDSQRGALFSNFGWGTVFTDNSVSSLNPVSVDGEFTAKGIVLTMIGEAMSSCSTAVKLDFPTAPMLNNEYPAVYGWRFTPDDASNARQAIILNVGPDIKSVNVRQLLGLSSTAVVGVEEINCFGSILMLNDFDVVLSDNEDNPLHDALGHPTLFNPVSFPTGGFKTSYYGYDLTALTPDDQFYPSMQHDGPKKISNSYQQLRPYSILRVFEVKTTPVATISSTTSCGSLQGASTDANIEYYQLEGGGTDAINCHADGAATYKWELKTMGGAILDFKYGNNVEFSYKSGNFIIYFHAYSDALHQNEIYSSYWGITINDPNEVSIDTDAPVNNLRSPCYYQNMYGYSDLSIDADNWWWSPTGGITQQGNSTRDINIDNITIHPALTTTYVCMAIDDNGCYGINYQISEIPSISSSFAGLGNICLDAGNNLPSVLTITAPNFVSSGNSYDWKLYKWNFEDPVSFGVMNQTGEEITFTGGDIDGGEYVLCTVSNPACTETRDYFYGGIAKHVSPLVDLYFNTDVFCKGDIGIEFSAHDNDDDVNTTFTWDVTATDPFQNESLTDIGSNDTDYQFTADVPSNATEDTYTISTTGTQGGCNQTVTQQFEISGEIPSLTFSPSSGPIIIWNGWSQTITVSSTNNQAGEIVNYEWLPENGIDGNELYNATITVTPTAPGTYTYTVFAKKTGVDNNECGCCSSGSVIVIVEDMHIIEYASPVIGILNRTYFLKGIFDNIDVCPTGATCSNRRWYWSTTAGGTLNQISGATNATLVVSTYINKYITYKLDVTISGTTYYDVFAVYLIHGYGIFSPFRMETDSIFPSQTVLSVFPNPSDGSFFVQLSGTEDEAGNIIIYDLFGRDCLKEEVHLTPDKPLPFHLPDSFADGIYIVAFNNDKFSSYFKIIINKP